MALFSTLIEDFSASTINTTTWPTQTGATLTGSKARLVGLSTELKSAAAYTISDDAIYAKWILSSPTLSTVTYQFSVHNDATNWAGFQVTNGQVSMVVSDGGTLTSILDTYSTDYYQQVRILHTTGAGFYFAGSGPAEGYGAWRTYGPIAASWTPKQTMYVRFAHTANNATRAAVIDDINLNKYIANEASTPPTIIDLGAYGTPAVVGAAPTGVSPDSTQDTGAVNAPTLSQAGAVAPAGIVDAEQLAAGVAQVVSSPTSTADTDTVGTPVAFQAVVTPATVASTETLGGAQVSQPVVAKTYGSGVYGAGLYSGGSNTVGPITVDEPTTVGTPALAAVVPTLAPATVTDNATVGTPAIVGAVSAVVVAPTTIAGTETVGAPTATGPAQPTGYGAGTYGTGVYSGSTNAVNTVAPTGIVDPELVYSAVTGGIEGGTTGGYGSGLYGAGIYNGSTVTPNPGATDGYGSGTYGSGQYPGLTQSTNDGYGSGVYGNGPYTGVPPLTIGTPPVTRIFRDPLHLLAIGPWSARRIWHGAVNYGIGKGVAPARPSMQLPGVQSKSFTLRLYDGSEATASCQFARGDAVVIEEMATDLWWRRRDPNTGRLEMIGRFNASHNDLSRGADGIVSSSLQFQDYATVMGARMVLKYLTTVKSSDGTITDQSSIWAKGTSITKIMRFATPTDLGIDISILDDDTLLGVTTQPFTLAPSTTVSQTYDQLDVVSAKQWEWWIETPEDLTKPPKLQIVVGKRGQDKGVTLFDYGRGPTPIASWQMRATSDTYANALYFQGKEGGVITTLPADIAEFGQRDAEDSDASVESTTDATGQPYLLIAAARNKLAELADRRPTFTVVLAPGFWRGPSHIDVGDTLGIRIKLGAELLAYSYRVTEIEVEIDGTGTETVTLTLGSPLSSKNARSRQSALQKIIRKLKNYETPDKAPYIDTSHLHDV